ncbi:MAG: hypothetical protein ACTHNU_09115 [Gaiellales bacterium]
MPDDAPSHERPSAEEASPAFDATTAERIVPSLGTELRLEKGSDPDSPLAGLLAAGARIMEPLDEAEYRRFLESQPDGRWASVDELVEQYGSFQAAVEAAGIAGAW